MKNIKQQHQRNKANGTKQQNRTPKVVNKHFILLLYAIYIRYSTCIYVESLFFQKNCHSITVACESLAGASSDFSVSLTMCVYYFSVKEEEKMMIFFSFSLFVFFFLILKRKIMPFIYSHSTEIVTMSKRFDVTRQLHYKYDSYYILYVDA